MSMRRISALAILILTLGTATAATAAPSPVQPETIARNENANRSGGKVGGMFEKLNLSADQKQKMQAVRDRYKDQVSQRMQAVRQARKELEAMMSSSTANASLMRDKHRQIMGLRQQLEEVQFESTLAMRDVLTPEQRSQFSQQMQQRREGAKARRQNSQKSQ
ncbi:MULTISPECIES: Spy/CpxP family protein refolding chaperone [unclassified Microcoleus]|uniref:Spy/CpxP family protein refolding chaperone n=1 Tax=unclassified Microcoleus TaxID=2642155 RepID=UPI002FD109CE